MTIILFVAMLVSYFIFLLNFYLLGFAIMIIPVTIMALSYYKLWTDLAKALLGISIGVGSLFLGFAIYLIIPNNGNEYHPETESPPMRMDFLLVAPIFSLIFVFAALLYYYRFRQNKNEELEKYYSYSLVIVTILGTIISLIQ